MQMYFIWNKKIHFSCLFFYLLLFIIPYRSEVWNFLYFLKFKHKLKIVEWRSWIAFICCLFLQWTCQCDLNAVELLNLSLHFGMLSLLILGSYPLILPIHIYCHHHFAECQSHKHFEGRWALFLFSHYFQDW